MTAPNGRSALLDALMAHELLETALMPKFELELAWIPMPETEVA